jgi:starvation-inducible DNA-binding protein
MTSAPYVPAFPVPHEREGVGRVLQGVLVDLVDLSLIGRQLHWTVRGPLFLSLHIQFDELSTSWCDLADTVAERAVALGFLPDGQAATVAAASQLTQVEQGPFEDHVAIRELARRVADVSERVRDQVNRVGEADPASQEVLVDVVRHLEAHQWMLRAQLKERA